MQNSMQKRIWGCFTLFSLSLLVLAVSPLVAAQAVAEDPGVTPDSFLWGLDNALDQLNLLLSLSPDAKATKGLEIASERLSEIKVMIRENKLEAAAKAEDAHGKTLIRVKESINEIEDENSTEEIKEVIEIEKELNEHEEDILELKLEIRIKIEGQLSPEQRALLDEFLASLLDNTGEVKIEIKDKKNKAKIKIVRETGRSEEEVDEEVEEIEKEEGVFEEKTKVEVSGDVVLSAEAQDTLDKLVASLDNVIGKVELKLKVKKEPVSDAAGNVTNETEAMTRTFIAKEEVKTEDTNLTAEQLALWEQLKSQSLALVTAAEGDELEIEIEHELEIEDGEEDEDEEELEIEVEIEDGTADVEIKVDGEDMEFTLNTTDKEIILSEIASRLNVTVDSIRSLVKFKVGDDEEKEGNGEDKEDDVDDEGDEGEEGDLECSVDADCDTDEACINNECEDKEKPNQTS